MIKLLSADFARLKKDKIFWISIIFMFCFGALIVLFQYKNLVQYGGEAEVSLNNVFFAHTILIGILVAVFCSLFIGTEYSDGTIRNKLVVGHTRTAIYFSNLIVSIVASLLMCVSFTVSVSVIGIPLLGFVKADSLVILLMMLGCIVMTIAFCSICTVVSMLNQNKAIVAVVTIIGVFALLIVAIVINSKLNAPEFYDGYTFTDSVGNTTTEDTIPNPEFLRGTKRAVYEFLYDFIPTGQAMQYKEMSAIHLWQMPLYSLIITIVSTFAGVFFFRKKDLK